MKKYQRAFTFLELLFVATIAAIVTAVAIPSYQSMKSTSRISSGITLLHGSLLLARTEAITRGRTVTVCRTETASAATPTCSTVDSVKGTNNGWGSGWLTFVDVDADGKYSTAIGDILLKVQGPLSDGASDMAIIPVDKAKVAQRFISFGPIGQLFGSGIDIAINRPTTDKTSTNDRFLCIGVGGRISVNKAACP